jgi:anti-sigma B factor antagonist
VARRRSPLAFAAVGPERFHPPSFSLDVRDGRDGATTVAVAGELDLATAGKFSAAVRTALERGEVVIDLRALEFMDSSGVRALNAAMREAAEKGRELRVCDEMQPNVVQMLKLTGMLGLLPLERGG